MGVEDPLVAAVIHLPLVDKLGLTADGLPSGFQLRSDGVYRRVEGKGDARAEWVWLCSSLKVIALARNHAGEKWGRVVEVTDPDDRVHRWSIPATLFAGDGAELRAGLFDLGLQLGAGRGARAALLDLIQQWKPRARALAADRLGWVDDDCAAFVLGDGRVLGAEGVVFQHENAAAAAADFGVSGDLDSWRGHVAAPCVGNPLLVVGISLAFAGPLLGPLGLDGGGLHLRGASSRGKSTIQRAAVSVWGGPTMLKTWRATANGLEGVAAGANGTILALDEMGELAGRDAGVAVYMLANGVGKSRADRGGQARRPARWKVLILSSGEISLADKMAEAGGRAVAGQQVRLLDVAADGRAFGAFDDLHGAEDGAAFAMRMKAVTSESHGTAGPAFVEALLERKEEVVAAVRRALDDFRAAAVLKFDAGGEGQAERAIARMALIAAAGEVATQMGITGWQPGEARDGAMTVLGIWFEGRGGVGPAEARDAVDRVRAFVVAHGLSRFEDIDVGSGPDSARVVVNRAGWRDGEFYYIAKDAWVEIHKGSDPIRAANHLDEAGHLKRGDNRNIMTRTPSRVPGRPRAYAVKASIMGAGDE